MTNPNYTEIIEGDIHYRTYLKSTLDGGFYFNPGDSAIWKKKGQWGFSLHSHEDKPAKCHTGGILEWFKEGRQNRDKGPQYIHPSGLRVYDNGVTRHFVYSEEYLKNHKCHKDNPSKFKFFTFSYLPPCCQVAYTDTIDMTKVTLGDTWVDGD